MVFLWALLIASVTYQLLRNLHPQIFRPIKPHFLYFKTPLKCILKDIFVMETCFWLEKVSQIISTFEEVWGVLFNLYFCKKYGKVSKILPLHFFAANCKLFLHIKALIVRLITTSVSGKVWSSKTIISNIRNHTQTLFD